MQGFEPCPPCISGVLPRNTSYGTQTAVPATAYIHLSYKFVHDLYAFFE